MDIIPDILKKLQRTRNETLQRLEGLDQAQLDWRPPGGGWSLGEVFMHLAIDEHYVREQIARPLLEGVQPPEGLGFLPPPPPHGLSKDVIAFWFQRARLQTLRMLNDMPAGENLDLTHSGGLDAMNGLEWFGGYAGHEAFHHRQIDELIKSLTTKSTKDLHQVHEDF